MAVVADELVAFIDAHALEHVLEGLGFEHGVGESGGVVGAFGVKADHAGSGDSLCTGVGFDLPAEYVDEDDIVSVFGEPFNTYYCIHGLSLSSLVSALQR